MSEPSGPPALRTHPMHGTLLPVHVLRFPVEVAARASDHAEELIRELTLIAQQLHEHDAARQVPGRLIALVTRLTEQYAGLTTEQEDRIAAAEAAGEREIPELVYHVPRSVAQASRDLATLLDEADEFCRGGEHLLTLATPPDLVRFRRWYLDEFIRQIAGAPPVAWPDFTG